MSLLSTFFPTQSANMSYKGSLDASGAAYPSSPNTGDTYRISVAGTISTVIYNVNDVIFWDGSAWRFDYKNPGVANGVASLDSTVNVPAAQLSNVSQVPVLARISRRALLASISL